MGIITIEDPRHAQLTKLQAANGGRTVVYNGVTYHAVRDGSHYKFCPAPSLSFETTYGSGSMPRVPDVPVRSSEPNLEAEHTTKPEEEVPPKRKRSK